LNNDGSVGSAGYWWLRSAFADSPNYAGYVDAYGCVRYYGAGNTLGCSPAFLIG